MRNLVSALLLLAACSSGPSAVEVPGPAELDAWIGDGVGLDRLITLTRELGPTSEFYSHELGFNVIPGQVFDDGFAVNYIYFNDRPLFEILSVYDKQLALEKWGDVEVRFLEKRQGGFQIGIGVSDIPRTRRQVARLGLPERGALGSPAQTAFDGPQAPMENKSAVLLAEELPEPYSYIAPIYFTNYTHVARGSGRERPPEARHPALRDTHPNTATRIAAVYVAVDHLDRAVTAYRDLGFTSVTLGEHAPWGARSATLDARNADIVLLAPDGPDGIVGGFLRERGENVAPMGVRIAVRDLALAREIVEHNTGRVVARHEVGLEPSFLVPPDLTAGVFLEFVQE